MACPICDDAVHELLLLPCCHSVCAVCLGDVQRAAAADSDVAGIGPRSAASSASTEDHIDDDADQNDEDKALLWQLLSKCPNHERQRLKCPVYLCEERFEMDQVVSATCATTTTATTTAAAAPLCSRHSQEMEFVCVDCKAPVCMQCAVDEHARHQFADFEVAAPWLKEMLTMAVTKTQPPKLAALDRALGVLADYVRQVTQLESEVRNRFVDAASKSTKGRKQEDFDAARDLVLQGIRTETKPIDMRVDDVTVLKEALVNTTALAQAVLATKEVDVHQVPDWFNTLHRLCTISVRLDTLLATCPPPVALPSMCVAWLRFQLRLCEPEGVAAVCRPREWQKIKEPVLVLAGTREEQRQGLERRRVSPLQPEGFFLRNPTTVVIGPDGNMVVCDSELRRVRTITVAGVCVRDIATGFRPTNIALTADGILLVSCMELGYIQPFSYTTGSSINARLDCTGVWGVAERPNGDVVAVAARLVTTFRRDRTVRWQSTCNGQLMQGQGCAVTWGTTSRVRGNDGMPSTDVTNDLVLVCDDIGCVHVLEGETGALVRTIGRGHMSPPTSVTSTTSGHIVVAECRDSKVGVYELSTGRHVHTFGGYCEWPSLVPGCFNGAFGVAALLDDRIVVTDQHNNRLQVF